MILFAPAPEKQRTQTSPPDGNFMKIFFGGLKSFASRILLRGGLLHFWVGWKTGRLVAIYKHLLLQASRSKTPVDSPRTISPGGRLEKMLFITDAMWEKRELVPELSRICEVAFVDVHPHITVDGGGYEHLRTERVLAELAQFKNTRFDAVMVYLRSTLQSAELTEFLQTIWSCPKIGLNLDCKTTFADYKVFRREAEGYRHWAGVFDCNLTNARAMVDVYAAAGFNCLYLPTGFRFDPAIHRLPGKADFEMDISFMGSFKPERQRVIEQLKRTGIEVQAFGGGWGGQAFVNDGWRIYQKSQLNLGIGFNASGGRITNLKNRDFECPGAGGCYLTTYDWELAGLFDIGREILCYRDLDEVVELYAHYIRRPDECRRIAAAGYERCRRDHTWEQRFRTVFGQMGFKPAKELILRG